MCFKGASGKQGDIPEHVALYWYRELYQFLSFLRQETPFAKKGVATQISILKSQVITQVSTGFLTMFYVHRRYQDTC
jgi:hypothetical protein